MLFIIVLLLVVIGKLVVDLTKSDIAKDSLQVQLEAEMNTVKTYKNMLTIERENTARYITNLKKEIAALKNNL